MRHVGDISPGRMSGMQRLIRGVLFFRRVVLVAFSRCSNRLSMWFVGDPGSVLFGCRWSAWTWGLPSTIVEVEFISIQLYYFLFIYYIFLRPCESSGVFRPGGTTEEGEMCFGPPEARSTSRRVPSRSPDLRRRL